MLSIGWRERLRTSRFRWVLYVFMVVGMCVGGFLLLQVVPFLAVYVLWPLTILGVPYALRERNPKTLLPFAMVVLLSIIAVLSGIAVVYALEPTNSHIRSSGAPSILSQGDVTPYRGGADTAFNFTVNVTTKETNYSAPNLIVVTIQVANAFEENFTMVPVDPSDNDASDGKLYRYQTRLPDGVHYFNYTINVNGTQILGRDSGSGFLYKRGPLNLSPWGVFAINLFYYSIVLVPLLILLLIILTGYWWYHKSRELRGQRLQSMTERGKEDFTCSNCLASVSVEAVVCPRCGARFDEKK